MNFSFENQGTHTYLVYTIAADDMIDSMSLGMITNNKIPGFTSALFTQMDATRYIKYDVSAKISVKQFFGGQVNKKRLLGVFNGIIDALMTAEDYMIDINSVLLDTDYIFADVSTCETALVCLPIISDDLSTKDIGSLFKNIMFTTQFDQSESCDHVAKIINYLNSVSVFSLTDFKTLLSDLENTANFTQIPQPVIQQPVIPQPVIPQPTETQPQPYPEFVTSSAKKQPEVPTPSPVQIPEPVQVPSATQTTATVQIPIPAQGSSFGQTYSYPIPAPEQTSVDQQETPEKKMSMFFLLCHYSKDNAEAYKKQKAGKKSAQTKSATATAPQKNKKSEETGFSIPGQNTSMDQGIAIPGQTSSASSNFETPVQQASVQYPPVQQPIVNYPTYTQPQMPQGHAMNFGETTVLGGGGIGETTVLGAASANQMNPCLIRIKNNEKINLTKPVFRIGKEKSYVDYFVSDNSAISRSHANIISRDGEYFVVDTNSTNHTYVNNQMIQSNVETKIAHGTKLRFANEDFEFKLY